MTAISMDVQEAKIRLSELISLVEAGTEVILMDGETPRARLVPFEGTTERLAGLHAGTIWTSEDFDDPLPDNFWMSGG